MSRESHSSTDGPAKSLGFVNPAPSSVTDLLYLIAADGDDIMTSVAAENLNRAHICLVRGDLTKALNLVEGVSELDVSQHVFQQVTALRMFLLSIIDPDPGRWEKDLATRLFSTQGAPRVVYLCIESDRLWNSGHLFQGLLLNRHAVQQSWDIPASWRLYGRLLLAKKLADMHVHYQAHKLINGIRDFVQSAGLYAFEALADALRSLLDLQSGRPGDALGVITKALRVAELRKSTIGVKSALSVAAMTHLSRGERDDSRAYLDLFYAHNTDFVQPDSVARAAFVDIALIAGLEGPRAAAEQLRARWDLLGTESGCFVEDPTRAAWMVATARRAGNTDLAVRSLRAIQHLARNNQEVHVLTDAADNARAAFRGEDPRRPLLLDLASGERPPRKGRHLSPTTPAPLLATRPDGPESAIASRAEVRAAPFRPGRLPSLTPRETDVARLVAYGLTNRQIANELTLSPHTVNFHLRRIFQKLSISNRAQLGHFVAQFENLLTSDRL